MAQQVGQLELTRDDEMAVALDAQRGDQAQPDRSRRIGGAQWVGLTLAVLTGSGLVDAIPAIRTRERLALDILDGELAVVAPESPVTRHGERMDEVRELGDGATEEGDAEGHGIPEGMFTWRARVDVEDVGMRHGREATDIQTGRRGCLE